MTPKSNGRELDTYSRVVKGKHLKPQTATFTRVAVTNIDPFSL